MIRSPYVIVGPNILVCASRGAMRPFPLTPSDMSEALKDRIATAEHAAEISVEVRYSAEHQKHFWFPTA